MNIHGIPIVEARDGMIHLMAHHKKEGKDLFVRVCPTRLEEVTDFLFDNGYTVGQCAEWFWWQQCDKDSPDKIKGSVAYEIDTHDNIEDWFNHVWKVPER